jgi:glycine hydroxymethyltransferase
MVPFDTESPMVTSGIRVGTPALSTRGFVEKDCLQVVEWIDQIITNIDNEGTIQRVKGEINEYMSQFPLFKSQEAALIVEGTK